MQAIKSALSEQINSASDYLLPLSMCHEPMLGSPVVSGHLKIRDGSVFTQFFVTGICHVEVRRQPIALLFPVLPVANGQTVIGRLDNLDAPAQLHDELLVDLVRAAMETIGPLVQASQGSGGLGLSPYPIFEEITAKHYGPEVSQQKRAIVQQLRFNSACAHLSKHMEVDEELWIQRQTAARKMGLDEIEHSVGQIYSLARSFGVKEILPKIEALIPGPLAHRLGTDDSNVTTKLTSMIVKLRRRGFMDIGSR